MQTPDHTKVGASSLPAAAIGEGGAPLQRVPELPVLPPRNAYLELAVFFAPILLIEYLDPTLLSLANLQPHPFWLPVLLLSLQYGTVSGLMAACVAMAVSVYFGFPEQEIGENHFNYLLRIWLQPVLWIAVAVILGQFRLRQINERNDLQHRLDEATGQRTALAEHAENFRRRCDRLERTLVCRPAVDARSLVDGLARLDAPDAAAIAEACLDCVATVVPDAAISIYLVDADGLVLADSRGSLDAASTGRGFDRASDLYRAIVLEARSLSALSADDEPLLRHAVAAVPILAPSRNRVLGMLKVDLAPAEAVTTAPAASPPGRRPADGDRARGAAGRAWPGRTRRKPDRLGRQDPPGADAQPGQRPPADLAPPQQRGRRRRGPRQTQWPDLTGPERGRMQQRRQSTIEGQPAAAKGPRRHCLALVLLVVALLELAGGLGVLLVTENWALVLAVHVAAVALLAGLRDRLPGDATDLALSLLAMASLGPLGTAAFAISCLLPNESEAPERLEAWYRRIALATPNDPVVQLSDRVAIGRTMNLEAAPPQSFVQLMAEGTLADRQTALGLIGRKFHPEYLAALRVALRSGEPVIRVQAAAVAARIQPQLQACIARLGAVEAADLAASTEQLLADTRAILTSGLVDETARRAAGGAMAALRQRALEGQGSRLEDLSRPVPPALAPLRSYESLLIESGRFAELRRLRRRYRAVGGRACGVRRLNRTLPAPRRLALAMREASP